MIQLLKKGTYLLTGTRHGARLLRLQKQIYAWIATPRIGALLVYSTVPHIQREVLSTGNYRLYDVVNEPHLSDQLHLELEFGGNQWQGYLLPTGLPDRKHIRRRIIPTHEIITPHQNLRRSRTHGPAFIKQQGVRYGLSH